MKKLYEIIFKKFAMISILLVLLTDSIFLCYFISSTIRNAQTTLDAAVNYSRNVLERVLDETEQLNTLVQKSSDVQIAIREIPSSKNAIYSQKLEINGYLYTLQENNTVYVEAFYILLDDGRQFKSTNFPLRYGSARDVPEYDMLRSFTTETWLSTYSQSMLANNYREGYVAAIYPLYNVKTGKSSGVIVEEIRTEKIAGELLAACYLEDVDVMLTDKNGEILLSVGESNKNKSWLVKNSMQLENGWTLTFSCEVWNLVGNILLTAIFMGLILSIVIIVFSLMLSRRIASDISEPINRLLYIMECQDPLNVNGKNDLIVQTDIYEVDRLFRKFSQMMDNIKELFTELEKKQQAVRKSEYAALQAQINPHFLYNTLDNITWRIYAGDKQEAIDEVMSLSRFFRISLSRGADMISIKDELEHVQLYLKIQKKRYGRRFDFEIKSFMRSSDMERFFVPKLILQPLAENCIYHGFEKFSEGGKIYVTVDWKENIIFSVIDNGLGIDRDRLMEINNQLEKSEMTEKQDSKKGYGIFNINSRIKNAFDARYGLHLESDILAHYTVAEIILPPTPHEA